jgi:hypothetical protein
MVVISVVPYVLLPGVAEKHSLFSVLCRVLSGFDEKNSVLNAIRFSYHVSMKKKLCYLF